VSGAQPLVGGDRLSEVTFSLTIHDIIAYNVYLDSSGALTRDRFRRNRRQAWGIMPMALVPLGLAVVALMQIRGGSSAAPGQFALGAVIGVLVLYLVMIYIVGVREYSDERGARQVATLYLAAARRGGLGGAFGPQTITLTNEGVIAEGRFTRAEYLWRGGISEIAQTADFIAIQYGSRGAFLIPSRAFATAKDADRFGALATKLLDANGGGVNIDVVEYLAKNSPSCPICRESLGGIDQSKCPGCGLELNVGMFQV